MFFEDRARFLVKSQINSSACAALSALSPLAALRDLTRFNQQAAPSRRGQSADKAAHSKELGLYPVQFVI
ncbi:MAG TPA: hypothetical protein VJU86_19210 [Pyrinomonadaceae bacterium]|nr:hypothetical protein [Pyrinomonadaceae bacterium]